MERAPSIYNATAKAALKGMGTRGQRATTIEARNGILRHIHHIMEAELNSLDIPLVFTRLLSQALFAADAFSFIARWFHAPPCLGGNWQCPLTCLSRTTNSRRERRPRTSLHYALKTKTTITGQHNYDEGDSVDYHCPATTKDDWGGWSGSFPVVRNDPGRGQVIIRVESRDVQVRYGDARHSLYIEALIAREIGSDNIALRAALTFAASLPAGGPAMTS
eukprot:6734042-Pyramimonas_sp.AAC.1